MDHPLLMLQLTHKKTEMQSEAQVRSHRSRSPGLKNLCSIITAGGVHTLEECDLPKLEVSVSVLKAPEQHGEKKSFRLWKNWS